MDININFNKEYFVKKFVNIDFIFEEGKDIYLKLLSFNLDKLCNIVTTEEFRDVKNYASSRIAQDRYIVNIKLKNINYNIIRYNIIICNRDSIGPLEKHFSLTDTCQLYDPTKFCEVNLIP